jgi:hypothetical protein
MDPYWSLEFQPLQLLLLLLFPQQFFLTASAHKNKSRNNNVHLFSQPDLPLPSPTSLPTTTSFSKRNKCFALAKTWFQQQQLVKNRAPGVSWWWILQDKKNSTRTWKLFDEVQENLIKILDLTKETQLSRLKKWRRIV